MNAQIKLGGATASATLSSRPLVPTRHIDLPLHQLESFPSLQALFAVWSSTGALPRKVDPLDIPPSVFPYVMLLDLDWEKRQARIRLAGDFVRERHGRTVVGATPEDFFAPADAAQVTAALFDVAERRAPSLAYRAYVCAFERYWSYHRLLLPLVDPHGRVDRIFKTIEPSGLSVHGEIGG